MTAEYYTGVGGFQASEGVNNYYVGQADTLIGNAAGFAIAALFMMDVPLSGPGSRTLFANTDANGDGWTLFCNPTTGEISFAVGTNVSTGSVTLGPVNSAPAGGSWSRVPILVVAAMDGAQITLSAQSTAIPGIAQAMGAAVYAPPAAGSAPTVGVANSAAPGAPGLDCTVLGVAYTDDLATLQQAGIDFYLSCRQSHKLNNPFEADPSIGDFQFRWSAQDGNYQPDANGVAQALWAPSAGVQSLTRVGLPTVRGFKDLDWHYTWAASASVDPAV